MTLQIEISDDILRKLEGRAADAGMSAAEFASQIVRAMVSKHGESAIEPAWLDFEATVEAEREADTSITLDQVRQELSAIRGSMSEVIRSERDRD